MTALEAPSEILLMALFEDAARAESAVESLWRRGFDPNHLSLLAREPGTRRVEGGSRAADWRRQKAVTPHLWFRFERSAFVRLPDLGFVVALGPIAHELSEGPAAQRRGAARLATALRRLGLPAAEAPRFDQALQKRRVVLAAEVRRAEAQEWAALLQVAGAAFMTAHLKLDAWPQDTRHQKVRRRSRRSPRRRHSLV
jgi:hypothetical protein